MFVVEAKFSSFKPIYMLTPNVLYYYGAGPVHEFWPLSRLTLDTTAVAALSPWLSSFCCPEGAHSLLSLTK
jgi:hypothetical protein